MMMQVNEIQTPITEELLASLLPEERDAFLDYVNNVPYIQRLISPDRKRARDLPRDSRGRIIVDISNPHIIEDMEYFRPVGNYFKEHGVFTKLRPNSNPNSEFMKFVSQELDRIWNGYVRESDGEWVTGEMYFYINYSIIALSQIRPGSKHAQRIQSLPEIWESTYFWSHYIEQARLGGIFNDFQGGQDAVIIARRGIGKSFFLASNMARLFVCGDSPEVIEKVMSVVTAYNKEYLTKDGILNKFVDMIDFLAENTKMFPTSRYKSSIADMQWTMGYKDADTDIVKGTKNTVLGVSSKDDPDKIRGKRSHRLIFEEFGSFPQFLETWGTTDYNVREGEYSFGQRLAIGTGGTEGSDFSGALELLNHPIGYHVYPLPNLFDKNSLGKTSTILFLGMYLNRKGNYNKDGVSDVVAALISEIKERTITKYNSSDPNALTKKKAEMPITLQEAIMRRDSTIYPVSDIIDVIDTIDLNPHHFDDMWVGRLLISSDGGVRYTPDTDVKVIKDFPHKDNKLEGAICIKSLPKTDSTGRVPWGRYIAGIDPYDDDASNTLSLGSLYILDLWTDELAFEYTGRPTFAEDFYENCRRALLLYNAECNYENNKKGLFTYFSKHSSLYLLADTLEFLRDKEMIRGNLYGNKAKGVNTSEEIKKYARRCIRDWLLKPVEILNVTEEGNSVIQEVSIVKNLTKIPFRALLKELSMWNPDGNFDRHDALGMLMLIREDKLRLAGDSSPADRAKEKDTNYAGSDPFFEKNYKKERAPIRLQ